MPRRASDMRRRRIGAIVADQLHADPQGAQARSSSDETSSRVCGLRG
jgi:hypothetical protein